MDKCGQQANFNLRMCNDMASVNKRQKRVARCSLFTLKDILKRHLKMVRGNSFPGILRYVNRNNHFFYNEGVRVNYVPAKSSIWEHLSNFWGQRTNWTKHSRNSSGRPEWTWPPLYVIALFRAHGATVFFWQVLNVSLCQTIFIMVEHIFRDWKWKTSRSICFADYEA